MFLNVVFGSVHSHVFQHFNFRSFNNVFSNLGYFLLGLLFLLTVAFREFSNQMSPQTKGTHSQARPLRLKIACFGIKGRELSGTCPWRFQTPSLLLSFTCALMAPFFLISSAVKLFYEPIICAVCPYSTSSACLSTTDYSTLWVLPSSWRAFSVPATTCAPITPIFSLVCSLTSCCLPFMLMLLHPCVCCPGLECLGVS